MTRKEYEVQVSLGLTMHIGMSLTLYDCLGQLTAPKSRIIHLLDMPTDHIPYEYDHPITEALRAYWKQKGYFCFVNKVWELEEHQVSTEQLCKREFQLRDSTDEILEFLLEKENEQMQGK